MKEQRPLLRLLGLPAFETVEQLADLMHLDPKDLKKFVTYTRQGHYYLIYDIPKKAGGDRTIRQPSRRLKAIQAWILRNILDQLSPSPYATAFRRRYGLAEAVRPHADNRYFLCMDLVDFFPTIKKRRVEDVFQLIGYSSHASDILASLCTCERVLPQGGVASPALSNLVAAKLDRRLAGFAAKHNLIFTRYADDLCFSGSTPWVLNKCQSFIQVIIQSEGFQVNTKKTRYLGPRRHCAVLGLTKNNSADGFGIGRKRRRKIRAAAHQIIAKGQAASDYKDLTALIGMMNFIRSVDSSSYTQLKGYINSLVQKYSPEKASVIQRELTK